jgi:ubiquinone/menaquinone biosynthesis C-methylase UbiE
MRRPNEVASAPAAVTRIYSERADAYLRFVRSVGYPRGLRAAFMHSPALAPGMRVLDAGCGDGVTTLALRSALEARGMPPRAIDAFDLTPAMLDRFRATLDASGIQGVRLAQADVLRLETLPRAWSDYDLVVTASMLEYVPRSSLSAALRGLRGRLRAGGSLLLFITRNNALTRPLIERWWSAHLYTRAELRVALEDAGFSELSFRHFPHPYRYLDVWGHVVSARA